MLIHAANKQEKKVVSQHIVTGMICKNCEHQSKGYCYLHHINVNPANQNYCSWFSKSKKQG